MDAQWAKMEPHCRGKSTDPVRVVIAIGITAIAARLCDLVADDRTSDRADNRAERLVALTRDDIAEHAADRGGGADGGDHTGRALLLASRLGLGSGMGPQPAASYNQVHKTGDKSA